MKLFALLFALAFVGYTYGQACNDVNAVFKQCGTACPTTCANYKQKNRVCIEVCKTGCFCKSPYVRDESSGKCVLTQQCNQADYLNSPAETCNDPNEEYKVCGTACPETCKNFTVKDRICNMMCVKGCFCKSPYVRDESTGKCVVTDDCLAKPIDH